MKFLIGDYVIIGDAKSRVKPTAVNIENSGNILDIKWNMAQIKFKNNLIEWINLKRVYHNKPAP